MNVPSSFLLLAIALQIATVGAASCAGDCPSCEELQEYIASGTVNNFAITSCDVDVSAADCIVDCSGTPSARNANFPGPPLLTGATLAYPVVLTRTVAAAERTLTCINYGTNECSLVDTSSAANPVNYRDLIVVGNTKLTITGWTLTNNAGAAIYMMPFWGGSELACTDCKFIDNKAAIYTPIPQFYAEHGAAIRTRGNKDGCGANQVDPNPFDVRHTVTLTNTEFTRNIAINGRGGAIDSFYSDIAINGGSFTNNTALSAGGAIRLQRDSTLTLNNAVTFSGNSAGDNGGAISANQEALLAPIGTNPCQSEYVITDAGSRYIGNSASDGVGGALYLKGSSTDYTGNMVSFEGNTASNVGGAVDMREGATADFTDALFESNSASNAGGAINIIGNKDPADTEAGFGVVLSIANSIFTRNTVDTNVGSAIRLLQGGTMTIDGSTFAGNVAGTAASVPPQNTGHLILANRRGAGPDPLTVAITSNIFDDNTGPADSAGPIAVSIAAGSLAASDNSGCLNSGDCKLSQSTCNAICSGESPVVFACAVFDVTTTCAPSSEPSLAPSQSAVPSSFPSSLPSSSGMPSCKEPEASCEHSSVCFNAVKKEECPRGEYLGLEYFFNVHSGCSSSTPMYGMCKSVLGECGTKKDLGNCSFLAFHGYPIELDVYQRIPCCE